MMFTGYANLRIALMVLVAILCALPTLRRSRVPGKFAPRLIALARKRWLAIFISFALSFALIGGLSLKRGYPVPYVHDEMSYMLAADTFAHGRLTNPTPAGWEHFESMHILVRPSYQSKYPPAQGLFMALGQVLFGHPIWGVWISTALACAAACWMLHTFVSPPWALLGGIIMAAHPQMLEWGQRYWGGSVAVLGGCLLLGGFGRIVRWMKGMGRGARSGAFWLAVGMFVVGNSRPFEGLVLTVLLMIGLFVALRQMVRRDSEVAWPLIRRRLLAPALLVLIPGGAWMAYYNYRVAGNPLRLPYQVSQQQYGVVPLFLFSQKSPEPVYHSDAVRLFHVREQGYYYRYGNWGAIWNDAVKSTIGLAQCVGGNAESLGLAALMLPVLLVRSRRMRFLIIVLALLWLAMLTETYLFGHYAAPAAGICAVLIIAAMRWMWHGGHSIGRLMVRCMVGLFLVSAGMWWCGFFGWKVDRNWWGIQRNDIAANLEKSGRKHIVFVHYDLFRPVVPWTKVALDVVADMIRRPLLGHFSSDKMKGLPQNPPPIPGESRTIWLTEEGMTLETYWGYYKLWPDRDWWRLELHGESETLANFYRNLADRYIRQQPGNHAVLFRREKGKDEDEQPIKGPAKLRHLIVRHNIHEEWVYNAADLETAPVIWARDLGQEKNRRLLEQYKGRKAWIINPELDARRMPEGSVRTTPRPYAPAKP